MRKRGKRVNLSLLFTFVVFTILTITALLVGATVILLFRLGVMDDIGHLGPVMPMVLVLLVSVLVGTAVSQMMGHAVLRPLRSVIAATNQLASGDFSARLHIPHPPEMAELARSFNRMAEELGSTELLRSDFVNNFSHEFKTPIVSIKGFAEMLKYGDLSESERNEYLDIVIGEAARLSSLATNVLNLTKVENQSILVDQSYFNVGEQIRSSVVLLQKKWEDKKLDISVDGEDATLYGNEELLSQVWLNLMDNAIKYSPVGGEIALSLKRAENKLVFSIRNGGEPLREETVRHVFDKFYQGDTSHTAAGNGLGLTLVKKIVDLHGGSVVCQSDAAGTVFTVSLPSGL